MIRRGLQFFLVWALLGAAPSYALQDFAFISADEGGPEFSGFYVVIGGSDNLTIVARQYASDGSDTARYAFIVKDSENGVFRFGIYDEFFGPYEYSELGFSTARVYGEGELQSGDWPGGLVGVSVYFGAPWEASASAQVSFNGGNVGWVGPGEFPDWDRAGLLVPFGFGFAMSFWAAAVAASIAMRWVRDLASAAS